jgi:RNA polymerase sigma-70 factor (ECF subfamily)
MILPGRGRLGDDPAVMEPSPSFQSTLWSEVLQAREGTATDRREALGKLCHAYWPPLVAWLAAKGFSREDAQDAVQGFFAHFLEKALMDRADPNRGRFRNYLLKTLEHWLANERRKAHAEKRGGGKQAVSIAFEPAGQGVPEDAYNRSWAMTVLRRVQDLMRAEFDSKGMGSHYQAICAHLSGSADRPSYEDLASRLGCSVADVGALLHAARRRLRELVRSVLRETVEGEPEVDQEVNDLFKFLLRK